MSTSSNSPVINIAGSNYLQFNNAVTGQGNKIGYNLATTNTGAVAVSSALDIIGNGTAGSRTINLWDNVTVNGDFLNNTTVKITNSSNIINENYRFIICNSYTDYTRNSNVYGSNVLAINGTNNKPTIILSGQKGLYLVNDTVANSGNLTILNNSNTIKLSIEASSGDLSTKGKITADNGLVATSGGLTVTAGGLILGSSTTTGSLNIYNAGSTPTVSITALGAITGTSLSAGSGTITTSGNISTSGTGSISTLGTGTITSTGLLTASSGLTVTTNGLTVTAGGLTVTNGGLTVTNGGLALGSSGTTGSLNIYNAGSTPTVSITAAGAITGTSLSAGSGTITTSGNISTLGSGTITSVGLLTASSGLTVTTNGLTVTNGGLTVTNGGLALGSSGTTGSLNIYNSSSTPTVSITAAGAITGTSLTASSGLTVTAGGLTVTAGGLTVTAGGLTVTAGGLTVTAGIINIDASTTGSVLKAITKAAGTTGNYVATVDYVINSSPTNCVDITNSQDVTGLKTFKGGIRIQDNNIIEFGYGLSKGENSGKIAYNRYDDGYLSIVGAGNIANRKVKIWDDLYTSGMITITGYSIMNPGSNSYYNYGGQGYSGGGDGIIALNITSSGSILMQGSGSIIIKSDLRIKKDINNLDKKKSLNCIRNIKPVNYKFIENNEKINIGFIAQNIEQNIPEAVKFNNDYIPNFLSCGNVNIISLNKYEIFLDNKISFIDDNIPYNTPFNIKIKKKNIENTNCIVTEIKDNKTIIIEGNIDDVIENNKIYIYGSLVNDFRVLNKDIIFTYAVSAIQELDNLVQELQEENSKLKLKIESIEMRLEKAGI